MRIGFVTGEFPPMEGGVGAFTQRLAQAMAAAGHEIHIITDRQARPPSDQKRIKNLRDPVDLGYAQLHPQVRKWGWSSLTAVTDLIIRHELDVVNIQYQAAAYEMRSAAVNFLPWRLKGVVKTAVTFHDLRVPYLFPKAGRLRETAVRFMARHAHGVIVTNPEDYDALTHPLIRQIPIGSNIASDEPNRSAIADIRRQWGLTNADCLVGYFGFLNPSKGADTLIEALANLDGRHHLVFIGGQTGSSDPNVNQAFLDELKQLVASLGMTERVHWTGFVPDEEVSTYLHAADMMAMPYRDGASLRRGTLMAALAHGRPLIATHPTTPTPVLIHGENIFLTPPDDPQALAQAVSRLDADSALRKKLGVGAEQVAGLFSWEKIARETAVFLAGL